MKRALLLLLLAGCETILGLGETTFTGANDAPPMPDAPKPTDACATCGTFTSCHQLETQQPNAPSGVYNIDSGTGMFSAYCDQTGDGGGWTLAMKVDGRSQIFAYDRTIWEDATLLAPNASGFDHTEAKLETFNAIGFTELRIGMEYPIDSGTIRYLVVPLAGAKMTELFAPNQQKLTMLGRDAWKGLMGPTASLQPNCNLEGTNIYHAQMRVRLGIIANEQADCNTPDSRLGVGGDAAALCNIDPNRPAGNISCYGGDNGDVELAAFAWVFVR